VGGGSDGGAGVHDVGESADSRIASGSLGSTALRGSGRLGARYGRSSGWEWWCRSSRKVAETSVAPVTFGGHRLSLSGKPRRAGWGLTATNHLVGRAAAATPAHPKAGEDHRQQDVFSHSLWPMPRHTHCLPHTCARLATVFVSAAPLNSQVSAKNSNHFPHSRMFRLTVKRNVRFGSK